MSEPVEHGAKPDVTQPPTNGSNEFEHGSLDWCLAAAVSEGASDIHLRPGELPFMRSRGHIVPITGAQETLTDSWMQVAVEHLTSKAPNRLEEFRNHGEADLSYGLDGVARFRVNIFRERGRPALTLRAIPTEVPRIDEIGVPPVLAQLALESNGLILVTGATGSGKTTTLAAMIDHINRNCQHHILTIEDPIEVQHPNHKSIVSQREVGTDTGDFSQALRRALRQDPDVILIGEIRDEETMRTALAAAETGHLVFATLHTIDATETIMRILDLFPTDAEKQARAMLAGALKGIISQRLARTTDGKRTPLVEVLINTGRIADCIMDPEETGKIEEAIAAGAYYGMQTFDQALIDLVISGRVSREESRSLASAPQDFNLKLDATIAQKAEDERLAEQARLAEQEELQRQQLLQQQQILQQQQMAQQQQQSVVVTPVPGQAPPAQAQPPAAVVMPVPGSNAMPPPQLQPQMHVPPPVQTQPPTHAPPPVTPSTAPPPVSPPAAAPPS